MHLLHDINSNRQTRLLNVLGQIAMYWEEKKKKLFVLFSPSTLKYVFFLSQLENFPRQHASSYVVGGL
jgi:hypothetical protein